MDSFQQGGLEVTALQQAGYQQVMLVDFDGLLPEYYRPWLAEMSFNSPYAVALLLLIGFNLLLLVQRDGVRRHQSARRSIACSFRCFFALLPPGGRLNFAFGGINTSLVLRRWQGT